MCVCGVCVYACMCLCVFMVLPTVRLCSLNRAVFVMNWREWSYCCETKTTRLWFELAASCDDTVCLVYMCVSVRPLLYKVELWFKDSVAAPHCATSGVIYFNTTLGVEARQGVCFCVCLRQCCNDRSRMRGGDGTLLEDWRSPVVSVIFLLLSGPTNLSRQTSTKHNKIFPVRKSRSKSVVCTCFLSNLLSVWD